MTHDMVKMSEVALRVAALVALPTVAGTAEAAARPQAMTMGTVTIPVIAGGYRVTLMIGPGEAMYT